MLYLIIAIGIFLMAVGVSFINEQKGRGMVKN